MSSQSNNFSERKIYRGEGNSGTVNMRIFKTKTYLKGSQFWFLPHSYTRHSNFWPYQWYPSSNGHDGCAGRGRLINIIYYLYQSKTQKLNKILLIVAKQNQKQEAWNMRFDIRLHKQLDDDTRQFYTILMPMFSKFLHPREVTWFWIVKLSICTTIWWSGNREAPQYLQGQSWWEIN